MNKFVHMELNTDDPQAARAFYGKLFDWKIREMPMGDGGSYLLIDEVGGIQKKPMADAPTQWLGYVSVDSLDASVAKIKQLGGALFVERMEVPGMGSFAVAADPTGGTFALWQPAPGGHGEAGGATKESKKKGGGKKGKKAQKKAEKAAKAEKKTRKAEKKADKAEKKADKKGKKPEKKGKKKK